MPLARKTILLEINTSKLCYNKARVGIRYRFSEIFSSFYIIFGLLGFGIMGFVLRNVTHETGLIKQFYLLMFGQMRRNWTLSTMYLEKNSYFLHQFYERA